MNTSSTSVLMASVVSKDAIEAWSNCKSLAAVGIIFEPSVGEDDTKISIRYSGGAKGGMRIDPVYANNFECTSSAALPYHVKGPAINVDCKRALPRIEVQVVNGIAQKFSVRDRASISIGAAEGAPFRLNFLPDATPTVHSADASRLETMIMKEKLTTERLIKDVIDFHGARYDAIVLRLKAAEDKNSKVQSGIISAQKNLDTGYYYVALNDEVTFPKPFTKAPLVVATMNSEADRDRFSITTTSITKNGFRATIHRHVDRPGDIGGWGLAPKIHWIAVEQ